MPENNLGQKFLKAIKNKAIKPRPRWQFLLKDYLIWIIGAASLIIGSFAFAVILHMLVNNDWDVYQNINDSLAGFILVTLPYLWLVFLGLFIFVAHYNIKHTKKGYRFSLSRLIIGSILISVLLGTLFYSIGLGQALDDTLTDRVPFYRNFLNQRRRIWIQADQGLLAGIIIEVGSDNNFKIIDFNKKEWNVVGDELILKPGMELLPGMGIRMVGQKIDDNNFKAFRVMPALLHQPFMLKDRMMGSGIRRVPGSPRFYK